MQRLAVERRLLVAFCSVRANRDKFRLVGYNRLNEHKLNTKEFLNAVAIVGVQQYHNNGRDRED